MLIESLGFLAKPPPLCVDKFFTHLIVIAHVHGFLLLKIGVLNSTVLVLLCSQFYNVQKDTKFLKSFQELRM